LDVLEEKYFYSIIAMCSNHTENMRSDTITGSDVIEYSSHLATGITQGKAESA
jgi:hypothetical protein